MKKQLAMAGNTLAFLGVSAYYRLFVARKARASYPQPAALITEPEVEIRTIREPDGALRLRWTLDADSVSIFAGSHLDQIDIATPCITVRGAKEAEIPGLDPQTRYYFEVRFTGGSADGRRLKTAERHLTVDGAVNLRDIGGYRTKDGKYTRWGLIYRSGALSGLTDAGHDYLQRLGVRLVCDLRTRREARIEPDNLPPGGKIEYWLQSIYSDAESRRGLRAMLLNLHRLPAVLAASYTQHMLARKAVAFGEALRRLADPANLPALIHCTAGKDRTGILIMLLLGVLGVPDETILADYSLSNRDYYLFRHALDETAYRLRYFGISLDDLLPALTANPVTLRAAMDDVRQRHGSIEGYLRTQAGLDDAVFDKLRDRLLER